MTRNKILTVCALLSVLLTTAYSTLAEETVTSFTRKPLKCFCENDMSSNNYIVPNKKLKKGWSIERSAIMSLVYIPDSVKTDYQETCQASTADGFQLCWTKHSYIKPILDRKVSTDLGSGEYACGNQGTVMGAGSCK